MVTALFIIAATLLVAMETTNLWSQIYVFESADWVSGSQGEIIDNTSLIRQTENISECGCISACLKQSHCFSYSHAADSGVCSLYNIRGNHQNTRHVPGFRFRYRRSLAVIGDWCRTTAECHVLNSEEVTCNNSICTCPPHLAPHNRTHCGDDELIANNQTTTENVTTTTTSPSITSNETLVTETTTTVIDSTETSQSSTTSSNSSTTTVIDSTETSQSSTTSSNHSTTTEVTVSTNSTTFSTVSSTSTEGSTTRTTSTSTLATTTTSVSTTEPSTTTSPTTTQLTTPTSPATTESSTLTIENVYEKRGQWSSTNIGGMYELACSSAENDGQEKVMVAISDKYYSSARPFEDMDDIKCATFSSLSSIGITRREITSITHSSTVWNECSSGGFIVSLIASDRYFNGMSSFRCGDLQEPLSVQRDQCEDVLISQPREMQSNSPAHQDWPVQCPQLPTPSAMVAILYNQDDSPNWKGIRCCIIGQVTTPPASVQPVIVQPVPVFDFY